MPATVTVLSLLVFFFLLQPLTVLMKQTRQLVCTVKQSIYLDVYEVGSLSCTFEHCLSPCNCMSMGNTLRLHMCISMAENLISAANK